MERRELLAILGSAAVAAPPKVDIANYKPRFFSEAEYAKLDRLTEALIPSDGTPGAHEAGVRYYIDTVLHYADPSAQRVWREGLAKHETIEQLAADATFFRTFKFLTVEAYALSAEGQKHFGYKGNTAIPEFKPPC